jgi:nucleoside-triphosphatase
MEKAAVFIITGAQGAGKTTCLLETVNLIKASANRLFGFYAEGEWENGRRKRFRIVDVQTAEQRLLCSFRQNSTDAKGNFVFYSKTVKAGEKILRTGNRQKGAVAVLDEVGKYELEGRVWAQALKELLKQDVCILMTVRDSMLDKVLSRFRITHPRIFTIDTPAIAIATAIENAVKNRS